MDNPESNVNNLINMTTSLIIADFMRQSKRLGTIKAGGI